MFGWDNKKPKKPKEKTKYSVWVGWGGSSSYYSVYEYRLLDNGVIEMRVEGHNESYKITLMPGTHCMISGGKWEAEKVE